jgi:hypothetical protein
LNFYFYFYFFAGHRRPRGAAQGCLRPAGKPKKKKKEKENLYNPRNNYITTEISPTTM